MSELPHATSDLVQSPGPGLPATKITPPWFGWIQRVERLMRGLDSDITAVETEVDSLDISGSNGVSASRVGSNFLVDGLADQHILASQIFGR